MFVFGIREETQSPGLAGLYTGETGHLDIRVALDVPLKICRYLFCCKFHNKKPCPFKRFYCIKRANI